MGAVDIQVFQTTDRQVIDKFIKAAEEMGWEETKVIFEITPISGTPVIRTSLATLREGKEDEAGSLLQMNSIVSTSILIRFEQYHARVSRGEPRDGLHIETNPNLEVISQNRFIGAIRKGFAPYAYFDVIERTFGPEFAKLYEQREQVLTKLEGIAQSLIRDTEEYRRRVDQREEERKNQQENDVQNRVLKLEADYQERVNQLATREQELERQKKELDDRRATHARRGIYRELKDALKARNTQFCLTKETQGKRFPVHIVFWGLITAIVAYGIFAYFDKASPEWYRMTRLSAGMLGLAATLVWYTKWNDQWFRQHAEEEFRLKRLDLDIDRASWLVEMALEFKDEKGSEIPPELVDRLSQNLFASSGGIKPVKHPTEELSSVLFSALSSLKVSIPGLGEATFDGRQLKKAQKEAEKEA
jgi:hypothetical protein